MMKKMCLVSKKSQRCPVTGFPCTCRSHIAWCFPKWKRILFYYFQKKNLNISVCTFRLKYRLYLYHLCIEQGDYQDPLFVPSLNTFTGSTYMANRVPLHNIDQNAWSQTWCHHTKIIVMFHNINFNGISNIPLNPVLIFKKKIKDLILAHVNRTCYLVFIDIKFSFHTKIVTIC